MKGRKPRKIEEKEPEEKEPTEEKEPIEEKINRGNLSCIIKKTSKQFSS